MGRRAGRPSSLPAYGPGARGKGTSRASAPRRSSDTRSSSAGTGSAAGRPRARRSAPRGPRGSGVGSRVATTGIAGRDSCTPLTSLKRRGSTCSAGRTSRSDPRAARRSGRAQARGASGSILVVATALPVAGTRQVSSTRRRATGLPAARITLNRERCPTSSSRTAPRLEFVGLQPRSPRRKTSGDWEDIPIPEWLLEVYRGIESSDNFLFVITPDSSPRTSARGAAHAVEKNKRLVPVLRRDAAPGTTVPARSRPGTGRSSGRTTTLPPPSTPSSSRSTRTRLGGDTALAVARVGEARPRPASSSAAVTWTTRSSGRRRSPDTSEPTPLQLEYVLASRAPPLAGSGSRSGRARRGRVRPALRCSPGAAERGGEQQAVPSVRRASRSRASSRRVRGRTRPGSRAERRPRRASGDDGCDRRGHDQLRRRCAALACAR